MGRASVLLVDDDAFFAQSMTRELAREDFSVDWVLNPKEALHRMQAGDSAAVVLDLKMEPLDGLAVIEGLNRLERPPRIILLSAYMDVPSTVAAMRAGAFDVLEKPVEGARLAARLRDALREPPAQAFEPPPAAPIERRIDQAILGETPEIVAVRDQVRSIARFKDVSVMILGETGTGKELVAEGIHRLSCPDEPNVAVNCAAVPDSLFESELFGHCAGAFTGAKGSHVGLLEQAGRGTVLLDEVGELPLHLQPKLLRVLETRRFRRLGALADMDFRGRVVSATNRALDEVSPSMRADLYFRLAGFTIVMPPLRERMSDVPILAEHFLCRFAERYPGAPTRFAANALEFLRGYDWPGNVRELLRVVEAAAMLSPGSAVDTSEVRRAFGERARGGAEGSVFSLRPLRVSSASHESALSSPPRAAASLAAAVDANSSSGAAATGTLRELERQVILDTFAASAQNLSSAARKLGIPRSTLRDKLKRYRAL